MKSILVSSHFCDIVLGKLRFKVSHGVGWTLPLHFSLSVSFRTIRKKKSMVFLLVVQWVGRRWRFLISNLLFFFLLFQRRLKVFRMCLQFFMLLKIVSGIFYKCTTTINMLRGRFNLFVFSWCTSSPFDLSWSSWWQYLNNFLFGVCCLGSGSTCGFFFRGWIIFVSGFFVLYCPWLFFFINYDTI